MATHHGLRHPANLRKQTKDVALLESVVELLLDQASDLEGSLVIRVVIAGAEDVGSEEDSSSECSSQSENDQAFGENAGIDGDAASRATHNSCKKRNPQSEARKHRKIGREA